MRNESLKFSTTSIKPLESKNSWMTSREPRIHDCCEVLESVAWIWRVLGVFPITIDGSLSTKKYCTSKFYAVYSPVLFAACFYNFIHLMRLSDLYFGQDLLRIAAVTPLIRTVMSMLCMFVSNVCRVFWRREFSDTINNISKHDIILEKITCRFNYESSKKIIQGYVWASLATTLFLMACDLIILIRSQRGYFTIEYGLWSLALIIQTMDVTVFVSLVGLLGLEFRALNEKIRIVAMRANAFSPKVIVSSDVCAENLRLISKAHYNLCALGKQINRIFDWIVIINVTTAFIVLTTTLYYIFDEVQREGETSLVRIYSYLHWEFFHSVPATIIVIFCNWTFHQGACAGKLIHKIRVKKKNSRLYESVKSFSLQLHHQKLEFTACGFFPLNSTLLQTMIGNITTYLVILIQFQPKLD